MSSLYPYADGDRLANRNTYFYTRLGGVDFLNAWAECRERNSTVEPVPPPDPVPQMAPEDPDNVKTAALLEYLFGEIHAGALDSAATQFWLDRLVNKFEVSKRIHEGYGPDFRAWNIAAHRNLSLYLRVAEVFEAAYARCTALPLLNVLLKIVDSLISVSSQLGNVDRGRLAWLIAREGEHVRAIANSRRVDW